MRFYDREREIELLLKARRIAIIGRRRVGKTRLVEEALKPITLFIPAEKEEALICRDWLKEIRERRYAPTMASMRDIVEYLMREGETVFIDELQNAMKVNPSFISDLQRLMDKYREAKVVVTGSMIGMSKKMIESSKSPLYGRFDIVLKLRELRFETVLEIMKDLGYNIQDAVIMWSAFGGLPKYYETLERLGGGALEFIRNIAFEDPFPLFYEVMLMLKEELGKEYKNYFSILEAISEGKRTLKEISSCLSKKSTSLTKYLYSLEREYEMVSKRRDFLGRGRNRYYISENLVDFWFYFLWRNCSKIQRGGLSVSAGELNKYVGRKFEELVEKFAPKLLPFKVERIGKFWGKMPNGEPFDIDVVASGEGKIAFFEIKWKDLSYNEAKRILERLKARAATVKGNYERLFVIVARSLKEKNRLDALTYDLQDLEKIVEKERGTFT